jgi:hypothetical protein
MSWFIPAAEGAKANAHVSGRVSSLKSLSVAAMLDARTYCAVRLSPSCCKADPKKKIATRFTHVRPVSLGIMTASSAVFRAMLEKICFMRDDIRPNIIVWLGITELADVRAQQIRIRSWCGMSVSNSAELLLPSKATTPCSTPVTTDVCIIPRVLEISRRGALLLIPEVAELHVIFK